MASRLTASPPITSAAAPSFHTGSPSCNASADAVMPKTGTSSAVGVTADGLWRASSLPHVGRAVLNERCLAKPVTPLTRHWAGKLGVAIA